jgi:preprotein translocase subunit SecG
MNRITLVLAVLSLCISILVGLSTNRRIETHLNDHDSERVNDLNKAVISLLNERYQRQTGEYQSKHPIATETPMPLAE